MSSNIFQDTEKLENDLWQAADQLPANSKLTSSNYFMPVLGVSFLRHAANRFDDATRQIQHAQASGKLPRRSLVKADYIFLELFESTRTRGFRHVIASIERGAWRKRGASKIDRDGRRGCDDGDSREQQQRAHNPSNLCYINKT